MSGIISFGEGPTGLQWGVGGWAYRGLIDHAISLASDDAEQVEALLVARSHHGLGFPPVSENVSPNLAARLHATIRTAAGQAAAGLVSIRVEGRTLDARSQEQFREAAQGLLEMAEATRLRFEGKG